MPWAYGSFRALAKRNGTDWLLWAEWGKKKRSHPCIITRLQKFYCTHTLREQPCARGSCYAGDPLELAAR